jgi:hypothetical protein
MQEYMEYQGCLMAFLQKALDDPSSVRLVDNSFEEKVPLDLLICRRIAQAEGD